MKIYFSDTELGAIQIHYTCVTDPSECSDPTQATVDPTFFEDHGNPICESCGEDLICIGVTVKVGDK